LAIIFNPVLHFLHPVPAYFGTTGREKSSSGALVYLGGNLSFVSVRQRHSIATLSILLTGI